MSLLNSFTNKHCFILCLPVFWFVYTGTHGFQQGTQFQQYVNQQPSIKPVSQIVGQFGGHFSNTVYQQLAHSQQYGVWHQPLQQQYHANTHQQQPYLSPQSGQFTGESQGIYMHIEDRSKTFLTHNDSNHSDLFWE